MDNITHLTPSQLEAYAYQKSRIVTILWTMLILKPGVLLTMDDILFHRGIR